MISRWSVGAYGSLVDINHLIPAAQILPDGTILDPPFATTEVYDPSWSNLALNWQLLMVQSLIYLVIIFFVKKQKDIL
jgi:putative ABC transport system ATP-binding protein